MQKTVMTRTADVKHNWLQMDAQGKVLGRFATIVARKLMGKHKVDYTPHIDAGDYVVVTNVAQIVVTGAKGKGKTYFSYSGFPGGLSQASFDEVMAKQPEKVLRQAVYRMLPDNKLRDVRMARLKIYAGTEHNHASQFGEKKA